MNNKNVFLYDMERIYLAHSEPYFQHKGNHGYPTLKEAY